MATVCIQPKVGLNHTRARKLLPTMRLLPSLVSALALLPGAFAGAPMKAVVVSFGDNTPDSVVDNAMRIIKGAGGRITHQYNIIKLAHDPIIPTPTLAQ